MRARLWLGIFVGFLVIIIFGRMHTAIGKLFGGLVAGLIAVGGMGRRTLAGFFAGIFGGVILIIPEVIKILERAHMLSGGQAIAVIILSLFEAVAAAIGGLISGAIVMGYIIPESWINYLRDKMSMKKKEEEEKELPKKVLKKPREE